MQTAATPKKKSDSQILPGSEKSFAKFKNALPIYFHENFPKDLWPIIYLYQWDLERIQLPKKPVIVRGSYFSKHRLEELDDVTYAADNRLLRKYGIPESNYGARIDAYVVPFPYPKVVNNLLQQRKWELTIPQKKSDEKKSHDEKSALLLNDEAFERNTNTSDEKLITELGTIAERNWEPTHHPIANKVVQLVDEAKRNNKESVSMIDILEEEFPLNGTVRVPAYPPILFYAGDQSDHERDHCNLYKYYFYRIGYLLNTALSLLYPFYIALKKNNIHEFDAGLSFCFLIAFGFVGYLPAFFRFMWETNYYFHCHQMRGEQFRGSYFALTSLNYLGLSIFSLVGLFYGLSNHELPPPLLYPFFINMLESVITITSLHAFLNLPNDSNKLKQYLSTLPFLIPLIIFSAATLNDSIGFFQSFFNMGMPVALTLTLVFSLFSLPMNALASSHVFEEAKQLFGIKKPAVELQEYPGEFTGRHLTRLAYGAFKATLLYMTTSYSLPLIITAGLVFYIQGAFPEALRLSASRHALLAIKPRPQPAAADVKEHRIEMQPLIDMKV